MPLFGSSNLALSPYFMAQNPLPKAKQLTPEMLTPRRRGLFGRMGEVFTPDRLQLLAAAFHDMGHGTNTFNDVSAGQFERRAYKSREARELEDRNDAQKRRQRRVDWAAGTEDPLDDLDPEGALTQRMRQTGERDQYAWQRTYDTEHPQPITPYQRESLDLERRGQDVSAANSRRAASSGGSGAYGLDDQSVQDLGVIVGLTGIPVGDVTGSRDRRVNTPVINAAMQVRRRMNLSPQDFTAMRLAYMGDRSSVQRVQQLRDTVAANEGAATMALRNVATLQRQLPRDQISSLPVGNQALQAYNATLGGQGPLAAYIGAITTARAEYARVISGNNSPPVEAMHEAERMLPNTITPQQLEDVISNLEREMEFRTEAFDTVLNEVQNRSGAIADDYGGGPATDANGEKTTRIAPSMTQQPQRPPGVPPNWVRDPRTGRWRAP